MSISDIFGPVLADENQCRDYAAKTGDDWQIACNLSHRSIIRRIVHALDGQKGYVRIQQDSVLELEIYH